MLIFVLTCIFTISKNIAQAAYPRASEGYHWADKNATIKFYPLGVAFRTEIEDAMATWNEVTDYRTGEPIVPMSLTSDGDCLNLIVTMNDGTASGLLGKTRTIYDEQTGEIDYVTISLNMDMPIRSGPNKFEPEYYDAQSIILHELGHAIGIAHCHEKGEAGEEEKCYSQTCSSNVMRPSLAPNTQLRTLAEYDIASKQLIYFD